MMLKQNYAAPFALGLALCFFAQAASAQIPRERADANPYVEEVFWSQNIIFLGSVTNLPKRNLNFTIMHVFGIATNGVDDLFGLDASANIRFGLDYGLTDWLSIGVGRARFDKLYDFRFKANLLRQTKDNRIPLEVAVKGSMGIQTTSNGFEFIDRLNYFASVMIARKFSDRLSLQITPMYGHFNTVFIERDSNGNVLTEQNDHFALGLAGRLRLSTRLALLVEYLPVIGKRSDGTVNTFSVGLNIETGGHVFQLFFTSSQGLTEQHVIARNVDDFFKGDFRLGFNINRVFGL